jgi:pimeloyl-ACP methyl ester carboxylesterase
MAAGLYPVVPHLGMVISRWRKRRPQPPGVLRTLAAEWAVSVALSAIRPVGFIGLPVSLRRTRGPRPIILVHGYAMSRSCFLPLARRLARAGLGPVLGFEYWSLGKVSSAARELGSYVEQVCRELDCDEVDVIGHSMGGVVSRYYVTLAGGAARVRNLITIASPHRGTDVSAVGVGSPSKELFIGSSLIQRLEAAPAPQKTRITAMWSRGDALVPGARLARLRGAEEIIYNDMGHVTMIASGRVARTIIERLRE